MTALAPRRAARAAAVALALLAAARAGAEGPAPMPVRLAARAGRLEASLDVSAVLGAGLERQVGNGLTNVIALYVTVVPEGGGEPVALYGRVVDVLFDVWDETYAVLVKDPRTPAGARTVLPDFPALLQLLAHPRDVDLGPLSDLPSGRFVVEARVEVNPISKEQLQRTREYIANPTAGARAGGGGSRSVLGAVASFLLREPDPGSDVRRLRSRPFARWEVATP